MHETKNVQGGLLIGYILQHWGIIMSFVFFTQLHFMSNCRFIVMQAATLII